MYKQLLFSEEGRKALQKGINKISNAVRITLGAKGRNVIFETLLDYPTITNDGVTIAREVTLKDPFERLGAQLIKEVASKTNDIAGDGTTTAVILAQAIYNEGIKNVAAGTNPTPIKKGIVKAVEAIVKELKKMSTPIVDKEKIRQVATISSNNDIEIGNIIAEAIEKTGKDGVITVEEAKTVDTTLTCVEGLEFGKGYISPYFINKADRMVAEYENVHIIITDKTITNPKDIVPIIQEIMNDKGKPFLLIANSVDNEALQTIVINTLKNQFSAVAVTGPEFGEVRGDILEDLAVVTGGKVIDEQKGLSLRPAGSGMTQAKVEHLGTAAKIIVSKKKTTIVGGGGDPAEINNRIKRIRTMIEMTDDPYKQEILRERLAKLAGGIAVIRAGAVTETEMREKRMRIEDSLNATKCAIDEGIVAGGGVAFLNIANKIKRDLFATTEENIGVEITVKAIEKPFEQIVSNAGKNAGEIKTEVLHMQVGGHLGFDANDGKIKDMFKAGIIDPTKVTRVALQNAASIASMLLTTEALITMIPEEKKEIPQMIPSEFR